MNSAADAFECKIYNISYRTTYRGASSVIKKIPSETEDQIELVKWMEKKGLKFYAVPNGGYRRISEAVRFKHSGVKAGVPDLCIPFPSGPYHGLYIELKRVIGGEVSVVQQEWVDYLNSVGYYAAICRGFEEAKRTVEYYLSLNDDKIA